MPQRAAVGDGQLPLLDHAVAAIQRNPVLAVAGAVVATAFVMMAVKGRQEPPSRLRTMERRAMREIESAERRLRAAARRSGIADSVEQLAATLSSRIGSLDLSQLAPLKEQAGEMLSRAASQLGMRSR